MILFDILMILFDIFYLFLVYVSDVLFFTVFLLDKYTHKIKHCIKNRLVTKYAGSEQLRKHMKELMVKQC